MVSVSTCCFSHLIVIASVVIRVCRKNVRVLGLFIVLVVKILMLFRLFGKLMIGAL